jgi:phosphatidylserine/phosphatidylglycerophosphate/cardiolipin synthase-like enzyme
MANVAANLISRTLRRSFGPLVRRRRHGELRRGRLRLLGARRARDTWWGDDARWFPGGTPPRRNNRITPLVDGAAYLADLYQALCGARRYVYIAGWFCTPEMPLDQRDVSAMIESRLADLLGDVARRAPVRVLLWKGEKYLFRPTKDMTENACQTIMEQGGDIRCLLDDTAHVTHCHHQKAVVIDGRVAYVGGMDLTTLQGDRWDTTNHPLRAGPNWHDVQLRLEGEIVADVEANFRQRWAAVAGSGETVWPHCDPDPDPGWDMPAQIVRTIPRRIYSFAPDGEYGIYHAYVRALRGAERLIYLENQYLWCPEIMDALIATMNRRRDGPLRIVIVLPARAYDGKWDNDQHVQKLREVDGGRGIVSVYSPYTSGPGSGAAAFIYRPIYVHAKVAIVDDAWLTVGSANLNNRGLVTDSEINVVVRDTGLARRLREQLWAEHLGCGREHIASTELLELVDRVWPARADQNAAIMRRADRPLSSAILSYQVGRMPGAWLLEEAQALTVEH